MSVQDHINRCYLVRFRQANAPNEFRVSYVPRGIQQVREPGGKARQVPEFKAILRVDGNGISAQWDGQPPSDSSVNQEDFDKDVRHRAEVLHEWLDRLAGLLTDVQRWAERLDWSTRRIDKPMKDSEIGDYQASALLLQEGTTRVLVEPIGRAAPGVDGVVDLYLLPAYDDIASIYHYDNRWNLHYMMPGTSSAGDMTEAPAKPLSKATLQKVLAEMKKNGE